MNTQMSNEKLAKAAAKDFRSQYELGSAPIPSLIRLIEGNLKIGVALVKVGEGSSGHGLTMVNDGKYLIAVGCTDHPMRLRSTLAHELGHLRMGTVDREIIDGDWAQRRDEEIQADAFARHLLIPLEAVIECAQRNAVTEATLSSLVQSYAVSPAMASIQLREAGVINQETCKEWMGISTSTLATQFGWKAQYRSLVSEAREPRAPQSLYARAIEGYQWGIVSPAAIARLSGKGRIRDVMSELDQEGIHFGQFVNSAEVLETVEKPRDTGQRLSPEELKFLTECFDD